MNNQNSKIGITATSILDKNIWNKVLVENLVSCSVLISNYENKKSKFELENKIKSELGTDNIQILSEFEDYKKLKAIFHFGKLNESTFPKYYEGNRITYLDFKSVKDIIDINLFEINKIDFIICDFFLDECIDIRKEIRDYISEKFIFLPTFLNIKFKKPKKIHETIIVKDKYKYFSSINKNKIKEDLRETFLNSIEKSFVCKIIEYDENHVYNFIKIIEDIEFDRIILTTEDPRVNSIIHLICSLYQIKISICNRIWPSFFRFTALNNRSPWMIREDNISKDQCIRSIYNSYLYTATINQPVNYSFNIDEVNYFNDLLQIVCSNIPREEIKDPYLAASIDIQNDALKNTRDTINLTNFFDINQLSTEDPSIKLKLSSLLNYSISNQKYIDENISFFSFIISRSLEIFLKSSLLSQKQYYNFSNIIDTYPQSIRLLIYDFEKDHNIDIHKIKNFLHLVLYSVTNYRVSNYDKILTSCVLYTKNLLTGFKKNSDKNYFYNISYQMNFLLNKFDITKNQLRISKHSSYEDSLWRDYSFSVQQYISLNIENLIYKRNNININLLHNLLDKNKDNQINNTLYIWNKARCYQFENKFSNAKEVIKLFSESTSFIFFTLLSFESFLLGNKKHALELLNNYKYINKSCVRFDVFRASLLLLYDDIKSFTELLHHKKLCIDNWTVVPNDYTTKFAHDVLKKAAGLNEIGCKSNSFLIDNRLIANSFKKSLDLIPFGSYQFSNDLKVIFSNSNSKS